MSPRMSIIPGGAVTDRSLEPRDLQVLCLLGRHTDRQGWCVRSQVKMAGELDCGRSSVQRSLDRLYDAGWVQKKRRGVADGDESQPSASYAYRVILDRDEETGEIAADDRENQSTETTGCPQVGTPPDDGERVPSQGGHPGAQPYVGTGAHTYMGTKNVPLERPHLERERDARAKDSKARFLVSFEARWPTAAADDRQRTAYAAAELSDEERKTALDSIAAFLDYLKKLKRSTVPAGWKYLEERRWTLLEKAKAEGAISSRFDRDSPEAKAIAVLHEVAGKSDFVRTVLRSADGSVAYQRPMRPRLEALATAGERATWVVLSRQQAGAWDAFLAQHLTVAVRSRLVEGALAPWPWPPRVDGSMSEGEADQHGDGQ